MSDNAFRATNHLWCQLNHARDAALDLLRIRNTGDKYDHESIAVGLMLSQIDIAITAAAGLQGVYASAEFPVAAGSVEDLSRL